tara:strand:- start:613 stop:789 length:177 start_codon:yes stop_codon:yes gene_type:complete
MPLEPGASLGPYEILAKIGEGGPGQVFQARDTTVGVDIWTFRRTGVGSSHSKGQALDV